MTSFETIIDMFMHRVEEDKRFFNYYGLNDRESLALAYERAAVYFDEARAILMFKGRPQVNFDDVDPVLKQFNFDLTPREKYLLSSLMYLQHLDRSIAYLKTLSVNYTSTDLRVFDPSNARKTFMTMYQSVKNECDELLDWYKNTDRNDGDYLGIDFAKYDSASE